MKNPTGFESEESDGHLLDAVQIDELSERFEHFAEVECRDSSPLYEHLARFIAKDHELLTLAAHCLEGQPPPNLFFGAVHLLLLQGAVTPLSSFYLDISCASSDPASAYPYFKDFCQSHKKEIIQIISSRLVQTNEVRRCSYLFPAFSWIADASHSPLSLIEIGTSAGLNLLWDKYAYNYHHGNDTLNYGDTDSAVQITSRLADNIIPPFPSVMPTVSHRVGLDLNIIDLRKEPEALWLRALIWPEHKERFRLLDAASTTLKDAVPKLLSGDAVELLPEVLKSSPSDSATIVFHTHVMNQLSEEVRDRLEAILSAESVTRKVFRLGNDLGGGSGKKFALKLMTYQNEKKTETHLADCDGHGTWVEWLHSGRS